MASLHLLDPAQMPSMPPTVQAAQDLARETASELPVDLLPDIAARKNQVPAKRRREKPVPLARQQPVSQKIKIRRMTGERQMTNRIKILHRRSKMIQVREAVRQLRVQLVQRDQLAQVRKMQQANGLKLKEKVRK